jgi:hypothetical protein
LPLGLGQRAIGIDFPLESRQERGAGGLRGLAGVVGGMQAVGADTAAAGHLSGVEGQGDDNRGLGHENAHLSNPPALSAEADYQQRKARVAITITLTTVCQLLLRMSTVGGTLDVIERPADGARNDAGEGRMLTQQRAAPGMLAAAENPQGAGL